RTEFVRYYLHKGHELLKRKENDNYPSFQHYIGDDGSIMLYEYYVTNNLITDYEKIKEVQNIICWGNQCIDIADPGNHP
ncbi:uncharacterized protein BDFB_003276, partial [Asbolus verrucosus]